MFYSFQEFEDDIKNIVKELKDKQYTCIACPMRGAMTIAQCLSYALDIPCVFPIDIKRLQDYNGNYDAYLYTIIPDHLKNEGNKVLVVDDIYDTGVTLDLIRKYLPNAEYFTLLVRYADRPWEPLYSHCIDEDEWVTFWWEDFKECI